MKQANISDLKAHLSAYLLDVRRGGRLLVLDRNTPVAQIVPIRSDRDTLVVDEAAEDLPTRADLPRVRLQKTCDPLALLREDRLRR